MTNTKKLSPTAQEKIDALRAASAEYARQWIHIGPASSESGRIAAKARLRDAHTDLESFIASLEADRAEDSDG